MLNVNLWISFLVIGVSLFNGAGSLRCGRVWDGPNPHKEVEWQRSQKTLSANWDYFQDINMTNSKKIHYSFAIISDSKFTKAIEVSSSDSPWRVRCRNNSGIVGSPDVVSFHKVKSKRKVITWTGLSLKPKHRYYFIIKAKQGDQVLYANSHGVYISLNGSINRTIYADDDDGFPAYKAGLIAMGCAIFCILLCLLLIILLVVARGKGEDKYTTTVHRDTNMEK